MTDRTKLRWGYVFMALAILNFLMLCVFGGYLGGFAFFGKIEGLHYFLGHEAKRSPTQFTEVSRAIYLYSHWHTVVTIVLFPIACAVVVWLNIVEARVKRARVSRQERFEAKGVAR